MEQLTLPLGIVLTTALLVLSIWIVRLRQTVTLLRKGNEELLDLYRTTVKTQQLTYQDSQLHQYEQYQLILASQDTIGEKNARIAELTASLGAAKRLHSN
ncbi:hypothetical protein [Spirosoma validum]|uniref:Uncharacterized protein n=1 Tax=Spirosoma validum TaxID=2771355 RepID=A0A927GC28_9BACT|nr:hypothetical protein [Spirosoma validum]MBD2752021.1 hypothetical protein [Spirosoma validum]